MKVKKHILTLTIFLLIGCSTTRDNFFSRNYHQTTAKYNGYFNAKQSMLLGLDKIMSGYEENYQSIIPIDPLFNIYKNDPPKNAYPNMDRVIEKTVKVIRRHSMEISDDEKNKWIDDNYFLMAQARFFKQDYIAAINTFNYIVRKYPQSDLVNQSLIWATKAHIKLNNNQTVENNLNYLLTESSLSIKEKKNVYEILAEYHIQNKAYGRAINYIQKSLPGKESRVTKTRKHFVLAQLYQEEEKGDSAIIHYDKVISLNPEYEMTFRAFLNQAQAFSFSSNNSYDLLKDYQKMLKDDKNKEYRDQIYYAISEIYLSQQDTTLAIDNLNNSINSFLYNIDQKKDTHTRLGDIYFTQKDYTKSYLQYDSIMTLITTDDFNYFQIKRKHKQLKEVSTYEQTIIEQDSLIYLASLPEPERNQIIDDYIEELRQKEIQERQAAEENRGGGNFNLYEYNKNQNQNQPNTGGGWYFYNPSAMSFGYSEFLSRWGNRKLEDNWRRKNKSEINIDEEGERVDEGPSESEKYNRQYYIDQLPLTEEKQQNSLDLIEVSYYKLGLALKEYFADYDGLINTHNRMLQQFPETEYKLLIMIHQMLAYKRLEKHNEADEVLKKIISEFPNNGYIDSNGRLIKKEILSEPTLYEEVFKLYSQQNYNEALALINQSKSAGDKEITENLNIKMIEAFCVGAVYGKKEYILHLEKIVLEHPNTELADQAQLSLDILYGSFYETEEDIYLTDFSAEHHIIISVEDLSIDVPQAQSIITKFNNLFYLENELQVTNLLLNKNTQIIKITKFKNKNGAMNYFSDINDYDQWESFLEDKNIKSFVISNPNFIQLFQDKKLSTYEEYFLEKYLNY